MESEQNFEKLSQFKADQNKPENREQAADNLLEFLETEENIEFLHGNKFETIFASKKNKREFIENLSEEDFAEMLNTINGILRNKEKEDWKMDGDNIGTGGNIMLGMEHISPLQADKPELLANVWSAAKEMNRENKNLKDTALLVSASINAIHPYQDANGRTSRFMYLALSEDFTSENKERLKKILSASATHDGTEIDINPGLIQVEIEGKMKGEIGVGKLDKNKFNVQAERMDIPWKDVKISDRMKDEDKKLLELFKIDEDFRFMSLFKFLRDNSLLENEKYLHERRPMFTGRSISYIVIERLMADLDQKQISEILQNYRDLKKRQIEILIDCIAHPEKQEYQIKNESEKISFKDYFEREIKKESEEISEEKRQDAEKLRAKGK